MNTIHENGEKNGFANTYPLRSLRYMHYRDKLLKNGFIEADRRIGHFYLEGTEKTAFVINLYDDEYGVKVLYGFASTAYMTGDEDWLTHYGKDDTSCQVRNILFIDDENSEILANEMISMFYIQYKDYSKDEILELKKERQKLFLDHFSHALKPLGFKKKNTRWTKDLYNGTALSFEAQKSAFSDEYYFNVIVHKISDFYAQQSFERVVMNKSNIYNWQLMNEEQIANLIQHSLTKYIIPKI